jgi:hypothetical protein
VSWAPLLLVAGAALLLAACESTQDKSARLAEEAEGLERQRGLVIRKRSKVVRVGRRAVLNDKNGTAVVLELRNTSRRTLARVPVAIDVRNGRRSVFKNDDAGLEPSLVGVPVLMPGQRFLWVHDQVLATGRGKSVRAEVGVERGKPPRRLPQIRITPPKLEVDPTSGILAVGKLENRSRVLQRNIVVHAVARRGERIVAAGRAAIEKLKPGARATYQVFFIGDPRGARITLTAPPTTFGQA